MAANTQRLRCKVCGHAERVQIDWLIARGNPLAPLARRFGLNLRKMYHHRDRHVTKEFKAAVKVGPFASEEQLRKICDASDASVLDQLKAMNAAVSTRWLEAF
jgi:hypothetical protein